MTSVTSAVLQKLLWIQALQIEKLFRLLVELLVFLRFTGGTNSSLSIWSLKFLKSRKWARNWGHHRMLCKSLVRRHSWLPLLSFRRLNPHVKAEWEREAEVWIRRPDDRIKLDSSRFRRRDVRSVTWPLNRQIYCSWTRTRWGYFGLWLGGNWRDLQQHPQITKSPNNVRLWCCKPIKKRACGVLLSWWNGQRDSWQEGSAVIMLEDDDDVR